MTRWRAVRRDGLPRRTRHSTFPSSDPLLLPCRLCSPRGVRRPLNPPGRSPCGVAGHGPCPAERTRQLDRLQLLPPPARQRRRFAPSRRTVGASWFYSLGTTFRRAQLEPRPAGKNSTFPTVDPPPLLDDFPSCVPNPFPGILVARAGPEYSNADRAVRGGRNRLARKSLDPPPPGAGSNRHNIDRRAQSCSSFEDFVPRTREHSLQQPTS